MKDYLFLKGSGVELAGVPNTISILPLGQLKGHIPGRRRKFPINAENDCPAGH